MSSKRPGSDSVVCEPKKKRKHMTISVQQKVDLLRKLDKGVSVWTLCQQYNIGSSTVYDIKKQKNQLLKFYSECESKKNMEVRKTLKEGKSSDLDSALIQWFKFRRAGNVPVSGEMLMAQAKIFHAELNLQHDCEYSQGWLQKFKTRHGISLHRICGEKSSADKDTATKFVDEFAQTMSPKRTSSESPVDITPKRVRKVMTLEEKLGVLNKLRGGMSFASVGRHYRVNESTIRTIKKNEQVIRASLQSCAPRSAKQVHHVRDKALTKMEYALFIWIEDQHIKGVTVDIAVIQEKAKSLYDRFKSDEAGLSTSATTSPAFQASKGWYANFKKRFFKSEKITGEAAKENGYTPEQVCHMDETGKSKNLGALQRRDKNLLPVFWMHNRKAWMTSDFFLDWFYNCFLCEVEQFFTSMGEEFKDLLTLDNTPDHPQLIEVVLPECDKDFDGFAPNQTVGEAARKTLAQAKKVAAEGFQSLSEDVTELPEQHDVELTEKGVEKLVRSSEEKGQTDDTDEGITLERLGELAHHIQAATDLALKMDPSMERSLKFKKDMAEGFSPYKVVMEEKKKWKQLPITMFFSQKPSATSTQPATTLPSKPCGLEQLTSPPDLHHHPAL